MGTTARISLEDQRQVPIIGKLKLQFNSNDELIFIETVYAGKTYIQRVTDDDYTGGTTAGAITREKIFHPMVLQ